MLVLSRVTGEQIIIAGNIRVKVVSVNHDCVRLGIMAPEDITIDREEIHERRLSRDAVGLDKPEATGE